MVKARAKRTSGSKFLQSQASQSISEIHEVKSRMGWAGKSRDRELYQYSSLWELNGTRGRRKRDDQ